MLINVAQLLKSPVGTKKKYEFDEMTEIDGKDVRVTGEVQLTNTGRNILANGSFKTEIEIPCSRCLANFKDAINVTFEEEFYPTIDILNGSQLPLPEEPGAFTINQHHVIDLNELFQQYVHMSMPMKPLCRVDCAGLCSTCGKNLNYGTCECRHDEIDPRLAKLKDLMS